MKDFWGNEIPEQDKIINPSSYQKMKSAINYRKSHSMSVRCKNCFWMGRDHTNGKTYFKCRIIGISSSAATDIRIGYVCDKFKEAGK